MCAEKADVSIYVLISVVYYDDVVAEETSSLFYQFYLFFPFHICLSSCHSSYTNHAFTEDVITCYFFLMDTMYLSHPLYVW